MEINNKSLEKGLEQGQEKVDERLIMLCDGVFAIAMTLLVLDISLDLKDGIDAAIKELLGKILIYIVTFFVIANYWSIHRKFMRIIKRMDTRFVQITFLFLAFVTFFPVAFNMMSDHGHFAQVTILYTLVLAGCGLSVQLLWFYASWKHRLIDPDMDLTEIRYRTISGLSIPIFFCLSLILIPFVHTIPFIQTPTDIYYSWLLIPVVIRVIRFFYERRERQRKNRADGKDQEQQTLESEELA
jgi:uncharacterized membrane protein